MVISNTIMQLKYFPAEPMFVLFVFRRVLSAPKANHEEREGSTITALIPQRKR